MTNESIQKKLERVRPKGFVLKYERPIGSPEAMFVELPYVVGVLGDFSGQPDPPLPELSDRKFSEIDRDNFSDVLRSQNPRLAIRVADRISGEPDREMCVDLRFASLDDFSPEGIAGQVPVLHDLLETRTQLQELATLAEENSELKALLQRLLDSPGLQKQVFESQT